MLLPSRRAVDDDDPNDDDPRPTFATKFTSSMVEKARRAAAETGAPFPMFVDPRTGLHMGVVPDAWFVDPNICAPMPVLDALSGQTRERRRLLAEAALTDRERAAMKAEGFVAIESDDPDGGQPEPDGWGREPVQQVHSRRLQEIRSEQRSTDYIFPWRAFNLLVLRLVKTSCPMLDSQQRPWRASRP
jgi:hypothetical protein